MLNDSRMHRASTSTYIPPTEPYATMYDLNTTMFATYAQTPPSAQPWLGTNRQTPNFLRGMNMVVIISCTWWSSSYGGSGTTTFTPRKT